MIKNSTDEIRSKIIEWLAGDKTNIEQGALLLLQVNKNKILYQNILKRKLVTKLTYELDKYVTILDNREKNIFLRKETEKEITILNEQQKEIEKEIENKDAEEVKFSFGKRKDHDFLPKNIQDLFEANKNLYLKRRALHDKLKTMHNDKDCDRYPFVKELIKIHNDVTANWKIYDEAKTLKQIESEIESETESELGYKQINNYRVSLTRSKEKLQNMDKGVKYDHFLKKAQKKYDVLKKANVSFEDKQLKIFKELGIII